MSDPGLELVRRFRAGEPEAFDEIVRRYQRQLKAMFVKQRRSREEAEELAQETFFRLLKFLQSRCEVRSLGGLLKGIGRKAAYDLDVREKRERWKRDECAQLPQEEPEPSDAAAEANETARTIEAAFASLSPKLSVVATLHFLDGLKVPEIALRLGLEPHAVQMRLTRATEALRAQLKHLRPRTGERG